GAYHVTEAASSGYTASYSAECDGTIAIDERKTCTVTNTAAAGDKCAGVSCAAPGECQEAGHCDAATGTCVYPARAGACGDDGNPCTRDVCDEGACAHVPGNEGAVCRPTAGPCDVAETCDGVTADCPADAVAATDVVCRPAAGACDAAETCDGLGA